MGLRGIKSHNLRTVHQILMKFVQKMQNMVFHYLPQMGIIGKNLDLKIIRLIPWRTIGLRKLKVFELRYE